MTRNDPPAAASKADRSAFERNGYLFPIRVMPADEMAGIRGRLERYLESAKRDPKDDFLLQFKVHMVFTWADDLIRHPVILDAVEELIGPDILVWNTAVLMKKPNEPDFVTYHQDVLYWGNHPDHVVGAWVALADSTPEKGCVRVFPAPTSREYFPIPTLSAKTTCFLAASRSSPTSMNPRPPTWSFGPVKCRCITPGPCMARAPIAPIRRGLASSLHIWFRPPP